MALGHAALRKGDPNEATRKTGKRQTAAAVAAIVLVACVLCFAKIAAFYPADATTGVGPGGRNAIRTSGGATDTVSRPKPAVTPPPPPPLSAKPQVPGTDDSPEAGDAVGTPPPTLTVPAPDGSAVIRAAWEWAVRRAKANQRAPKTPPEADQALELIRALALLVPPDRAFGRPTNRTDVCCSGGWRSEVPVSGERIPEAIRRGFKSAATAAKVIGGASRPEGLVRIPRCTIPRVAEGALGDEEWASTVVGVTAVIVVPRPDAAQLARGGSCTCRVDPVASSGANADGAVEKAHRVASFLADLFRPDQLNSGELGATVAVPVRSHNKNGNADHDPNFVGDSVAFRDYIRTQMRTPWTRETSTQRAFVIKWLDRAWTEGSPMHALMRKARCGELRQYLPPKFRGSRDAFENLLIGIFVQPEGAGSHTHSHQDAWAHQVYGSKAWMVVEASKGGVRNASHFEPHFLRRRAEQVLRETSAENVRAIAAEAREFVSLDQQTTSFHVFGEIAPELWLFQRAVATRLSELEPSRTAADAAGEAIVMTARTCNLNPGETLRLPDRWWHSTAPVDPAISMTVFDPWPKDNSPGGGGHRAYEQQPQEAAGE